MSGKTFKVKTADGESWEWDIHTADEDETEGNSEEDEVEWNRAAFVSLALGLGLCFVGLVTLLISIGLLFSGPGAVGGLIAGSLLLGAGFVVTTPSAVYLVRDPKSGDARNRSRSVAIILPTPDFKKNVVASNPQEAAGEDRYLLAAERLTAMLEEPETETKEVSTAAWNPSPRGSPKTKLADPPASLGSSLSVPEPAKKQASRGSPRVIRRVHSSSLKKSSPDAPLSFSAQPSSSAILVPPDKPSAPSTPSVPSAPAPGSTPEVNVVDAAQQPKHNFGFEHEMSAPSTDQHDPTDEPDATTTTSFGEEAETSVLLLVGTTDATDEPKGNSETAQNPTNATDAVIAVTDPAAADDNVDVTTTYHSRTLQVVQRDGTTTTTASSLTTSGSQRLKVAAPVAAPSVVEFHSDDEDLKAFLLSIKKQKDDDTAMLY